MQKILITGVAGFIGSHVARRFVAEGFDVVGVDDLSNGKIDNVPPEAHLVVGDLALAETMSKIPPDCRKVLHLAGQSSGEISFDNPIEDLERNTVSTLNLIRYGIENRVERVVYASSMSVYGSAPDANTNERRECVPLSCYGVGKLASEHYLRIYQSKLAGVCMRMFSVYGPGQDLSNLRQGMVSIYLAQALSTGQIEVKGSYDRFRDFVFIDDVVEAWFRAGTRASALCKTFNVGTGRKTTVRQLLDAICALVPGATHFSKGNTPGDQSGIYADVAALRASLGIEGFTSLEEGLPIFVEWARSKAEAA